MTTITAYTAVRMQAIEDAAIVNARLGGVGGTELILTNNIGTDFNVGNVQGIQGVIGPNGEVTTAAMNAAIAVAHGTDAITEGMLDGGAVTVNKLGSLAVTKAKLGPDSVDGTKIENLAIDSEHYTLLSVDRGHIANDAINGAKIADLAINSEHYVVGSIDKAHIGNDQIDSQHYVNRSIDAVHIATGTITTNEMAANSVDTSELATGAVENAKTDVSAWVTPTLLNGWVTYTGRQGFRYRKRFDEVQIEFSIKNGTMAEGVNIFTLPLEFRPPREFSVGVYSFQGGPTSGAPSGPNFLITTGGQCQLRYIGGNTEVAGQCRFSITS